MSTGAFEDVLDEKTRGKADYGVSAKRKAELAKMAAPLSTLDAHGIEVPHRDFAPEDAFEYPTTVVCGDGKDDDAVRVHLHQDVREDMDDDFGDFGAIEDEDDVVWTAVSLADGTVTLTVVGDWGKRREVPYEDFAEDYEPITVTVTDGDSEGEHVETREVPRFGY